MSFFGLPLGETDNFDHPRLESGNFPVGFALDLLEVAKTEPRQSPQEHPGPPAFHPTTKKSVNHESLVQGRSSNDTILWSAGNSSRLFFSWMIVYNKRFVDVMSRVIVISATKPLRVASGEVSDEGRCNPYYYVLRLFPKLKLKCSSISLRGHTRSYT